MFLHGVTQPCNPQNPQAPVDEQDFTKHPYSCHLWSEVDIAINFWTDKSYFYKCFNNLGTSGQTFFFLMQCPLLESREIFPKFYPWGNMQFTPSVSLLAFFHQAESSCTTYGIKRLKTLCPINLTIMHSADALQVLISNPIQLFAPRGIQFSSSKVLHNRPP